jgi:hypothetical protein
MTEIEAIKKHRRLEEAKRIERMRAYEREKEYEAYQKEQQRLEAIQMKRQKIINKKIEANLRAQAMKESIKGQIHSAKSMLIYFLGSAGVLKLKINPYNSHSNSINYSSDPMHDKTTVIYHLSLIYFAF